MYRMDWTDDRLQERFESIDQRFDRVDRDIRDLRSEMNQKFEGLQRAMIYGAIALSGSFIAGFAALIGLIATQL
jgi:hypothetical protein